MGANEYTGGLQQLRRFDELPQLSNSSELRVTGNPVYGSQVNIQLTAKQTMDAQQMSTVQVIDLSGKYYFNQAVPTSTLNKGYSIQLPVTVKGGIYLVLVKNPDAVYSSQAVIVR